MFQNGNPEDSALFLNLSISKITSAGGIVVFVLGDTYAKKSLKMINSSTIEFPFSSIIKGL